MCADQFSAYVVAHELIVKDGSPALARCVLTSSAMRAS
jgi:hypothetical protein